MWQRARRPSQEPQGKRSGASGGGGQLQLRALVLPQKALGPFVPLYLQGVLQVGRQGGPLRAERHLK